MNIRFTIYSLHRSTWLRFESDWLREKGSNLHLRVQSPTCCRLHHPAKPWVRRLPVCFFCSPIPQSRLEACVPRINWSRWKELNRHRSIINRVLWPLSYTAKDRLSALCFVL